MEQDLHILKALSDRNRLRIVAALSRRDELCACEITELLDVTGATASRHLSILQNAGLVASRKEGRWIHYHLTPPDNARPLFQWLEQSPFETDAMRADFQTLEKIETMGRETLCKKQRNETETQ
jgi:ArsR family transcriptional regulator